LESIGDIFDENQAKHDVLVFGGVHIGAQFIGGGPQGLFNVFDHDWF